MNILVINGPNLNLLGEREIDLYGSETLEELMMWLENCSECIEHNFKFYQSNHEGDIIDFMHDERHWTQGIVINPAAFSHYSYAIMDAIKAISIPTVEVHITNIKDREEFRKNSVISQACIKQISGLGKRSYLEAIKYLSMKVKK
jgi:3-dehydroquinate dehydratase-2